MLHQQTENAINRIRGRERAMRMRRALEGSNRRRDDAIDAVNRERDVRDDQAPTQGRLCADLRGVSGLEERSCRFAREVGVGDGPGALEEGLPGGGDGGEAREKGHEGNAYDADAGECCVGEGGCGGGVEHGVEGGSGCGEVGGEPEYRDPDCEEEGLEDAGYFIQAPVAAVCKVPSGAADHGLDLQERDPEHQQDQQRGDGDAQRHGPGVGIERARNLAEDQLGEDGSKCDCSAEACSCEAAAQRPGIVFRLCLFQGRRGVRGEVVVVIDAGSSASEQREEVSRDEVADDDEGQDEGQCRPERAEGVEGEQGARRQGHPARLIARIVGGEGHWTGSSVLGGRGYGAFQVIGLRAAVLCTRGGGDA
ncbi:hypothetical protein V494_06288 [Pseudogymnoascus sp. VKM F-4513 (FW-928)]|nr:hypothetical protein V494_06288 [Pseudogymnoascus sp. VKM F-4513 (FW-928)]